MPSEKNELWDDLREKIIGLGENSIQKSYYPELQQYLNDLKRFRTLLDQTNDIIFLVDTYSNLLTDFNSSASFQLGYSSSELSKKNIMDLIIPEDHTKFKDIFSKDNLIPLKENWTFETSFIKKNKNHIPMEVNIQMVQFSEILYLVMVARDIQERITAKEALKESEEYYKTIFENTGSATIILEKNTTLSMVNSGFENLTGYSKKEVEGIMSIEDIVNPEMLELSLKYHHDRRKNKKLIPKEYETMILNKRGDVKYVIATVAMIPGTKKSLVSLVDITSRKIAEKELKTSLNEKNVLLKEIHHRVKNNLQIISSLLNLQSINVRDSQDLEIFKESQDRIKSMAIIHEQLYQSKNLASINFANYIKTIMIHLFHSYSSPSKYIVPRMNLEDINLDIDIAIPCGLIINELVTNSLKHAFEGKKEGIVDISLKCIQDDVILSISDDGVGFDTNKININSSLGLKLVKTLVEQIDGSLNIKNDKGSNFLIIFKESFKNDI